MRVIARELIGRRAELKTLENALAEATRERLQLVLLSGPAGMGKSALVRHAAEAATRAGAHVIVAECAAEDAARPFGALLHSAGGAFADTVAAQARERSSPLDAHERHRAFAAIVDRLRDIARDRPVVLVLEDAQWSDDEMLHLLPYLSRRAADAALLVVATFRSEDAGSGALAGAIAELRGRDAIEIDLGPLTLAQVGLLIRSALGSTDPPHAELRSFVAEHSGGNPLFAEELARALVEGGWLIRAHGLWRPARPLTDAVLPSSIAEGVRARLALMPEHAWRVLSSAAVIGQRFPFDLLVTVTGRPREVVIGALRAGIDAQLVEERPGGRTYAFRHALLRDALLAELIGPERQDIHRAVALALEAATPAADRASVSDELARHFESAGDAERAVRYHLMAVRASGHGAVLGELIPTTTNGAVAMHLERALALAPADHPDRAEMLRAYAWAQEDPARRLPLIEESLARAQRVGDEQGVALSTVMAGVWRGLRSDRAGISMVRDGIRLLEAAGSDSDIAAAHSQLARIAMLAGDPGAIAMAERAIELARSHELPVLVANGLVSLGTRMISEGRIEGIERIRAGLALARENSATFAVLRSLTNLWLCLVGSSAPDDEIREVERALGVEAADGGMTERQFELRLITLFFDANWDEALELIEEMCFPPFAQSPVAAMIRAYVGVAREGPARFQADVLRTHEVVKTLFGSQPMALAPEILHLAGDPEGALEAARYVARALGGRMTREFVNTAATAALAAAVAARDDAAVEEWLERCGRRHAIEASTAEGRRTYAEGERALREGRRDEALDAFARSAEAFECRGATLLARTLPRLRRAGLLAESDVVTSQKELAAVMAMWRAVDAKWYLGHLREWAGAHGLRGWTVSARRGPRLTPREVEVARQVAKGLTNREIGAALGITERTAETHVQRILTKLDLRGRAQLATWFAGSSRAARART